ncbi:unnamed protein product [marine sediment metagenome]|uniref:Elongation factor SelB fourth winged-helix domain-containing protein n=1 Tax=marine sediment metagenome TaxID=412755 RepID=X1SWB6_9ZZZZ
MSGAQVIEVATTNITTVADYTEAINDETAMVLLVHNSSFKIHGFAHKPTTFAIADTIPQRLILAVDQGSGTTTESIPGERRVSSYLQGGAHLVCFSGDKVLGGQQAGLIVGRQDLIRTIAPHPLMRVVRSGKTIHSLIEDRLVRKLTGRELAISLARDRTGLSRKYVLPILNRMESNGLVRRAGSVRIITGQPETPVLNGRPDRPPRLTRAESGALALR